MSGSAYSALAVRSVLYPSLRSGFRTAGRAVMLRMPHATGGHRCDFVAVPGRWPATQFSFFPKKDKQSHPDAIICISAHRSASRIPILRQRGINSLCDQIIVFSKDFSCHMHL
ncbi:MAG: hypothetical protein ACK4KT_01060 [Thermaurantimonas sp.]